MRKILNYQPGNLMRKTPSGNLKSIYIFSQMSAVRTGVRAYMDATLLPGCKKKRKKNEESPENANSRVNCLPHAWKLSVYFNVLEIYSKPGANY